MINFLPGIQSTTAALNAERVRMDVITQNIANANATHGTDGQPYQRQQVVFENALSSARENLNGAGSMPQVARIQKDTRPPQLVFQPGHPDADDTGMVALPNINIHEEMADLIIASRSFEANLAAVKTARSMALQTLAIGKR
jgi:flagellar basal-body rod protein FlgC